MPIAAAIRFTSPALAEGGTLTADFDWRQTGDQTWEIAVTSPTAPRCGSTGGGTTLAVDGTVVEDAPRHEYDRIYARFAGLLDAGTSLVDMAPFELVADAFLVGRREEVEPFID